MASNGESGRGRLHCHFVCIVQQVLDDQAEHSLCVSVRELLPVERQIEHQLPGINAGGEIGGGAGPDWTGGDDLLQLEIADPIPSALPGEVGLHSASGVPHIADQSGRLNPPRSQRQRQESGDERQSADQVVHDRAPSGSRRRTACAA